MCTLSAAFSAAIIMYVSSFPVLKRCNNITHSSSRIFRYTEFNEKDRVMLAIENS